MNILWKSKEEFFFLSLSLHHHFYSFNPLVNIEVDAVVAVEMEKKIDNKIIVFHSLAAVAAAAAFWEW